MKDKITFNNCYVNINIINYTKNALKKKKTNNIFKIILKIIQAIFKIISFIINLF